MLNDSWDISHICIAVDDLENAMAEYSAAFGLEWGPVIEITPEFAATMPEGGSTVEGLREVISRNGATEETWPTGAIQLASADESAPAYASFACTDGKHFVHHIAYWVDDVEAESAQLLKHGYTCEFLMGPEGRPMGACFKSPAGVRIEISSSQTKLPAARFLATGKLDLNADDVDPALREAAATAVISSK